MTDKRKAALSISLTKGKFALVDAEDFDFLNTMKWEFIHTGLAATTLTIGVNKRRKVYMHKLIMRVDGGTKVDHRDRNSLNNQKYNLRLCTLGQNNCNRRKQRIGKTASKFKGVHWDKQDKRWRASVSVLGVRHYMGSFTREEFAAFAYDVGAMKYQGEFAKTNFSIPATQEGK